MAVEWRLRLDVPIELASEPGFLRALHSADFRAEPHSLVNTWLCPATRLLTLKPNWAGRNYYSAARPLSDFTYQAAGWKSVQRSRENSALMTTIRPVGSVSAPVALSLPVNLPTEDADAGAGDTMVWGLASNFLVDADEGIVLHLQTMADEINRRNHWVGVQWDNLFVQISGQGKLKVWQYPDRANLNTAPTLVDERDIALPGELDGRFCSVVLQPVPGLGLAVITSFAAPFSPLNPASANAGQFRGFLVRLTGQWTGEYWTLTQPSVLRVAVNPYLAVVVGVQGVRFSSSGTFTDAIFEPNNRPGGAPETVRAIPLKTLKQDGATAEIRNKLDTAAWNPATDRLARVRMSLSSDDPKYTPFVQGYGVDWAPAYQTRATTPYTPRLLALEWTEDERGGLDGRASLLMDGATARGIAERGDATFSLESNTDGAGWVAEWGGFATDWELDAEHDLGGQFYYRCQVSLRDFYHRLSETHQNLETAFDGLLLGDAINLVLRGAGFRPIDPLPAEIQEITVPISEEGSSWRYAPHLGDSGTEALRALLLLARRQYTEWMCFYKRSVDAWVLEKRARDTSAGARWSMMLKSSDHNVAGRVVRYQRLRMEPTPPEANIVTVTGATAVDPRGKRLRSPVLQNSDSLVNASSADYLGRPKISIGILGEGCTQGEINRMARALFDAGGYRRVVAHVGAPDFVPDLRPNRQVDLKRDGGSTIVSMWVKRRTVKILWAMADGRKAEHVDYELDSVWESELGR
jgi:hypothetical protein